MQVKTTNRQKSAVSLMITLTTIMAALLTFIAVSKTVPGEINIKSKKPENQPLLADSLAL